MYQFFINCVTKCENLSIQPSAISYQLSAISYQLKALAYGHATRMATLREQLSASKSVPSCSV
ncbi:MAG: hypothetical protein F6J98_13945 [Moorea sp. SIO4G2]|nr:hypothetical protein [Moorena sp. SIO4G2]